MSASILETLTRSLGPSVLARAGELYGESGSAINKGLTAAVAAVMAPLVTRAADPQFTRDLFNIVRDAPAEVALLDEPDKVFTRAIPAVEEAGPFARLRSLLFGKNTQNISSAIASAAGIKSTTASSLLALALPTVLGYLSRLVRRENLDPVAFGRRLAAERAPLAAMLPASLSSLLSAGTGLVDDAARVGGKAAAGWETADRAATAVAAPVKSTGTWIAAAIFGLLALGALYALFARTDRGIDRGATPGAIGTTGYLSRALPDGTSLRFPAASTETRLLEFIESARPVDRDSWFEFDRINFETDSANLRADSREQLSNIAAIIKAYPPVRVKIGGYTDNSGDPGANLRLSQARAESVMAELRNQGVGSDRIEAEGYGDQHPIADNATTDGRAKNRRVAVRVTAR